MGLEKDPPHPQPDYPTLAEHREPRCRWRKLAALAAALAAFGAVAYGGCKLCLPLIERIFSYPQQFRTGGVMIPTNPPPPPSQNNPLPAKSGNTP